MLNITPPLRWSDGGAGQARTPAGTGQAPENIVQSLHVYEPRELLWHTTQKPTPGKPVPSDPYLNNLFQRAGGECDAFAVAITRPADVSCINPVGERRIAVKNLKTMRIEA